MEKTRITSLQNKKNLSEYGDDNFSDLIKIIPSKYKLDKNLGLGDPLSEMDIEREYEFVEQILIPSIESQII